MFRQIPSTYPPGVAPLVACAWRAEVESQIPPRREHPYARVLSGKQLIFPTQTLWEWVQLEGLGVNQGSTLRHSGACEWFTHILSTPSGRLRKRWLAKTPVLPNPSLQLAPGQGLPRRVEGDPRKPSSIQVKDLWAQSLGIFFSWTQLPRNFEAPAAKGRPRWPPTGGSTSPEGMGGSGVALA